MLQRRWLAYIIDDFLEYFLIQYEYILREWRLSARKIVLLSEQYICTVLVDRHRSVKPCLALPEGSACTADHIICHRVQYFHRL